MRGAKARASSELRSFDPLTPSNGMVRLERVSRTLAPVAGGASTTAEDGEDGEAAEHRRTRKSSQGGVTCAGAAVALNANRCLCVTSQNCSPVSDPISQIGV